MTNYNIIGKNGKELYADVLLHPGEVLAEELEAREILQKDFAALIGMRPPHFNELLKGNRHVSALLALKLEQQLGIKADFWMRLQVDHDLKLARRQIKAA
jgi:addiction module HigA family antidote